MRVFQSGHSTTLFVSASIAYGQLNGWMWLGSNSCFIMFIHIKRKIFSSNTTTCTTNHRALSLSLLDFCLSCWIAKLWPAFCHMSTPAKRPKIRTSEISGKRTHKHSTIRFNSFADFIDSLRVFSRQNVAEMRSRLDYKPGFIPSQVRIFGTLPSLRPQTAQFCHSIASNGAMEITSTFVRSESYPPRSPVLEPVTIVDKFFARMITWFWEVQWGD